LEDLLIGLNLSEANSIKLKLQSVDDKPVEILPKYVSVFHNKKGMHGYKIQKHPKCSFK
jgi:hypothetical protein